MSARLAIPDIQPVVDLLEQLQNVQRAMRDLHDGHEEGAQYSAAIVLHESLREVPVAHTHRLSYWVVLQGLAAMERELLSQLQNKEISVESALPMKDAA